MKNKDIDIFVGNKLKYKRKELGLTQKKLGDQVGVTFQQIQKYEKGSNRIPSEKLYKFSNILEVPIKYFFEGFENNILIQTEKNDNNISNKEIIKLVETYKSIKDKNIRESIINLLKDLGNK